MLDYIIVGAGLSGIAFSETLLENQKSILVFDNNSQNSSRIAGGLYNPVILKRFSEVWNAKQQLEIASVFYDKIEKKLGVKIDFQLPVYRKFFSIEEQNNWFTASDKPNLTPFLSSKIIHQKYNSIDAPFGYGEVLQTGYIEIAHLISVYYTYLKTLNSFEEHSFDYANLKIVDDYVEYGNFKAKHIVFAEGFGMHANPFFNYLPLDGTKGELLLIKCNELELDAVIMASVFILPLGNHLFKVGATYNWNDKTDTPTEEGRKELVDKLNDILSCEFEIIEHFAGIRPTVNDRRPLLGTHPIYNRLHILNGMGTRGVMLAPSMALELYNYIENNSCLDKTIDINRYAYS